MTKLTGPNFSLLASKSLASLTTQKRRGTTYTRKRPVPFASHPPDPNSQAVYWRQFDRRGITGLLTFHWQSMSSDEKNTWEEAAKKAKFTGTGYSWFLHIAPFNLYLHHGLAAYWSMNAIQSGQIIDLSGQGNHGNLMPSYPTDAPTLTPSINNKFGLALALDGINNYVQVPNSTSIAIPGDITIEFWMYHKNAGKDYQHILNKQYADINGTQGFRIYAVKNATPVYFGRAYNDGWTYNSIPVPLNAWHHVVWTVEAGQSRMYRDGVLVAGPFADQPTIGTDSDLRIGVDPSSWNFNGRLDEVRIYNRVLSETEIRKHWWLFQAT